MVVPGRGKGKAGGSGSAGPVGPVGPIGPGKGTVGLAFVGLVVIVLLFGLVKSFHTIDAGDQGVPVCLGVVGDPLEPGFHVVAPWCGVEGIDVRTHTYAMVARNEEGKVGGDDSLNVQASDSVSVKVDAAVIYHLDRAKVAQIYTSFKPVSNIEDVIRNTSRRQIRDAAGPFTAEDLIGAKRAEFGKAAQEKLQPDLAQYGVVVERVEIRDISPTSESYKQAISAKVEQQQKAQAKQFELDAARKDAEIKKVTAEADAEAQRARNAVPPDPRLLQQAYIEALRNSSNRVIITDGNTPVLIDPNAGTAATTPTTTP